MNVNIVNGRKYVQADSGQEEVKVQYKVIVEYVLYINHFEQMVNSCLSEGWQLHGEMIVCNDYMYQALTKEN